VLGAILGIASATVETQGRDSPARLAFETIIKAAERGGKMVKGLLRFARQNPADECSLDMNAVIREEVALLERTALSRVRTELDLAGDLRPIHGDPAALGNAVMNLLVNAADSMPQGGTLSLRTWNVDPGWIEVRIEDTGTGMPPEVLDRAMDPFYTTKKQGQGTGLGLSMVYSTVKAHQGRVEILSEPGRGTCVLMHFQINESVTALAEPTADGPSASAGEAKHVLVVDDDELIQASMGALLNALGHRVTTLASGEEALAALGAGLQPDVVILDLNMPGLGGSGTLPLLRALRPALPVLLATGRADQSALDLIASDPRTTLLGKPFTMQDLGAGLRRCIARK
jgi:CheY-like chemotaxis protein